MSKVDINKARDTLVMSAVDGDETPLMLAARVMLLRNILSAALDELEASRKPVAPCHFDVSAARVELARIGDTWEEGERRTHAFEAACALLDRALAAIDAGRPESAPVAITDAIVEEAAKRAWSAPWDGPPRTVDEWHDEINDEQRDTYRNEARAVLEYAASLGGVVPAQTVPLAPAVDPRAERLTRYRCAALQGLLAGRTWKDYSMVGEPAEAIAHVMLAAEKEPARG